MFSSYAWRKLIMEGGHVHYFLAFMRQFWEKKINLFFLYFFQVFLLSMIEVISINLMLSIFLCVYKTICFMINRVLCTLYCVHLCFRNILCIDIIIYSDNFDFFSFFQNLHVSLCILFVFGIFSDLLLCIQHCVYIYIFFHLCLSNYF